MDVASNIFPKSHSLYRVLLYRHVGPCRLDDGGGGDLDAGPLLRDVLCEHGDAADLRDHADGAARAGRLPLEVPLPVRQDILILRRLLGE